jgi:hypothetical protein
MDNGEPRCLASRVRQLLLVEDADAQNDDANKHHEE